MNDRELPGDEILRRKFGTIDVPVEAALSGAVVRFIESAEFFFIATSNRRGECDASYRHKGRGVPAIKVLDQKTMVFPHYMGNGSFRSLGNVLDNRHIGMSGLRRRRANRDAER
jgi:uncharacterized protein